jgi:hypothetical protein
MRTFQKLVKKDPNLSRTVSRENGSQELDCKLSALFKREREVERGGGLFKRISHGNRTLITQKRCAGWRDMESGDFAISPTGNRTLISRVRT